MIMNTNNRIDEHREGIESDTILTNIDTNTEKYFSLYQVSIQLILNLRVFI